MKKSKILGITGALLMLAGSTSVASTLYGSDVALDNFLTIDAGTGASTVVGPVGTEVGGAVVDGGAMAGLAYDSNTGTIYGSDYISDKLYTIDSVTGLSTAIGSFGFDRVAGLAFDPNTNTLYGSDFTTDTLLIIDVTTGVATPVGSLGTLGGVVDVDGFSLFDFVVGLAFDANTSTLYGTDRATDQLLSIDTATGVATALGLFGGGYDAIAGLAFDSTTNTLYGTDVLAMELVTIDSGSGVATGVGALGAETVFGLTVDTSASAVPIPSAVWLFGSGLMGLIGIARRKV